MSLLARLGLAVVRPRAALALAGEREHAGRSGSDLLLAILVLLVVSEARALISAGWLGVAVEPTLGLRAAVQALTDALVIELFFLIAGALVIWGAAGPRRDLGRASDLACVAVLPILLVDLVTSVVLLGADVELPRAGAAVISAVSYAWTGMIVALATFEARRPVLTPKSVASATARAVVAATPAGRKAGWAILAVVVAGLVVQTIWVVRYLDRMRPVMPGDPAPGFKLPTIVAQGALGEPFELASARGKIVVVDFWATWCGPCLKAMPHLEAFQRKHASDVVVITINIDEPAEARALFDERGYSMILLAGDQATQERYDVGAIPHTVVIDRSGVVRRVVRGGKIDLEREISGR